MSFLTGRVSYLTFNVGCAKPAFDEEYLERLKDRKIGRQRLASADCVEAGWSAGDHILDTDFTLEKNIINDALFFDLAIETDRLPSDMLRAYYAVELKALTKNNPSGFPSAKQKREAKESARERLENEAKDGRFKKRKTIPVMWDGLSNRVLFGATSVSQVDRLCSLFGQTFQKDLECVTAGVLASEIGYVTNRELHVESCRPAAFVEGASSDVAWIADESNRDFLGNEFLLWLWHLTDTDTDTVKLSDNTDLTLMLARSINLDCPRGQTGHETITHEGPTRLPEARRAVSSGKLPRKVGITMVRCDKQYELAIGAEMFSVGSAKLPPHDESITDARAKLEDRVQQIRDMDEALTLLYRYFLEIRLSTPKWEAELANIRSWLKVAV